MVCDLVDRQSSRLHVRWPLELLVAAPAVFGLAFFLGQPDGLPLSQAVLLAALMPVLVKMGNFTLSVMEADLGIDPQELEPGRGRLIDGLRPLLFTAPVVFHALRHFTEIL